MNAASIALAILGMLAWVGALCMVAAGFSSMFTVGPVYGVVMMAGGFFGGGWLGNMLLFAAGAAQR